MGRFEITLEALQEYSRRSPGVIVGYSGGKDSLVTMDLCVRSFSRVEAFFMYLVPGLDCVEHMLAQAEARWGIKIRQYPHWLLRRLMYEGVYCPNSYKLDDLPEWKLQDIYRLAVAETGIPVIATGAKKSDSLWRRRQLGTWCKDLLYPVKEWSKLDVLAYLRLRGIPEPASSGKSATAASI